MFTTTNETVPIESVFLIIIDISFVLINGFCFSARMFDFMDSGMMEGLQHNLLLLTERRTLGKISAPGDTVHLQSQILARRIESDGSVKFLLRWHPQDV